MRFIVFGYGFGVIAGLGAGMQFGTLAGWLVAWLGGGAASLMLAVIWYRTAGMAEPLTVDAPQSAWRGPPGLDAETLRAWEADLADELGASRGPAPAQIEEQRPPGRRSATRG